MEPQGFRGTQFHHDCVCGQELLRIFFEFQILLLESLYSGNVATGRYSHQSGPRKNQPEIFFSCHERELNLRHTSVSGKDSVIRSRTRMLTDLILSTVKFWSFLCNY